MSEAVGILEGCVGLDGFIDRVVAVNFSTVDGTAIGMAIYIYFLFLGFSKFHSFSYNTTDNIAMPGEICL